VAWRSFSLDQQPRHAEHATLTRTPARIWQKRTLANIDSMRLLKGFPMLPVICCAVECATFVCSSTNRGHFQPDSHKTVQCAQLSSLCCSSAQPWSARKRRMRCLKQSLRILCERLWCWTGAGLCKQMVSTAPEQVAHCNAAQHSRGQPECATYDVLERRQECFGGSVAAAQVLCCANNWCPQS
jgi:hypothetical protein